MCMYSLRRCRLLGPSWWCGPRRYFWQRRPACKPDTQCGVFGHADQTTRNCVTMTRCLLMIVQVLVSGCLVVVLTQERV